MRRKSLTIPRFIPLLLSLRGVILTGRRLRSQEVKGGGGFDRVGGTRGMRGERPRGVVEERQVTLCVASEVVMTRGPDRALKRARGATRRVATGSKVRAKKRTHPTSDRVCGEKKQLVGDERREIKVLSVWGVGREGKFAGCADWLGSLSLAFLSLSEPQNQSLVRSWGKGKKGRSLCTFRSPVESTNGRIAKWASWKRAGTGYTAATRLPQPTKLGRGGELIDGERTAL